MKICIFFLSILSVVDCCVAIRCHGNGGSILNAKLTVFNVFNRKKKKICFRDSNDVVKIQHLQQNIWQYNRKLNIKLILI